jgi:hypothetical protein
MEVVAKDWYALDESPFFLDKMGKDVPREGVAAMQERGGRE